MQKQGEKGGWRFYITHKHSPSSQNKKRYQTGITNSVKSSD
jgi:hypothetical protein